MPFVHTMDGPQMGRICRLCYESHTDYIEIYGVRGRQMAVAEILSKHFDYEQVMAANNDSATIVLANIFGVHSFQTRMVASPI